MTDDRQTDVRERESGYTIDPDDISRCRQDQKQYDHLKAFEKIFKLRGCIGQ